MAYVNDEISKAVEAHMTQTDDLRYEIDAYSSGKNVDRTARYSHSFDYSAPPLERPLNRSSIETPFIRHPDRLHIRDYGPYNEHFPIPSENRDIIPKFDERRVYHNPHDLSNVNEPSYPRHLKNYNMHRAIRNQPLHRYVNYPPPQQIVSSDTNDQFYRERSNFVREKLTPSTSRREADLNYMPLPRPHDNRIYPEIRRFSQINSEIPTANMPSTSYSSHQSRKQSPLGFSGKPRTKENRYNRPLRKIRSRVYSETEENEEVPFDVILEKHKRSQLDHQFQLTNYAYDNKEDAVIRDEKFFVLHKEDQQNQRRIDESFSNIRHDIQERSYKPISNNTRLDERYQALQQHVVPSHILQNELVIPQKALPTSTVISSPSTLQKEPDSEKINYSPGDTNSLEKINQVQQRFKEYDEDDDEELLQLRREALSSAIKRNTTVTQNNDQFSKKYQESKEEEEEETYKPRKRKSKQAKEKKKISRKETKTSATQDCPDLDEKSTKLEKSPNLNDSIDILKREARTSPEKDFTDPKILTLGNEVMKKKVEQEQFLFREIRGLDIPEEGSQKIMDLLKSENDRGERKLKKTSSEIAPHDEHVDNYEEVEMDMDDTVKSSNIVLEMKQAEMNQSDDKSNAKPSPLPLPPGLEVEVETPFPPTQEVIWELLDDPLPVKADSTLPTMTSEGQTPAEKLIASIRANVKSTIDQQIKGRLESSSPFHTGSDVTSVGSPFTHAFDQIPQETYPEMATDLSAKLGDMSNRALDSDSNDEASVFDAKFDTESNPTPDENEKRSSIQDEEELRAKLLQDMALRKTREANQQKQQSETTPDNSNNIAPIAKPAQDSAKKKKKRSRKSIERYKRYLAQRKLAKKQKLARMKLAKSQELIASTERNSSNRAEGVPVESLQSCQINADNETVTEANSAAKSLHCITTTAQSPSSLVNEMTTSSSKICHQFPNATTATQTSTNAEQVQAISSLKATAVISIDRQTVETPIPPKVDLARPAKQSSPSPAFTYHALPGQSAKRRTGNVGNSGLQKILHPPVVVNLDPSSDEDDQHDDHLIASLPINAEYLKTSSKKLPAKKLPEHGSVPKSTSSTALKCVNERKRKSPIDAKGEAKRSNRLESARFQKVATADHSENLESKLSELETKLEKVGQLLDQDQSQLVRLDQKRTVKQNELDTHKKKLSLLKKEIEKTESGIASTTNAIEKIKADVEKVATTMTKRRKLESVYVRQIADLRQQIEVRRTVVLRNIAEQKAANVVCPSTAAGSQIPRTEASSVHPATLTVSSFSKSKPKSSVKVLALQPSTSKTTTTVKDTLHERKALLLQKERKLKLEKEKFLLKRTEYNLLLIKQKAKQSLKAKRLRKSSEQSFYQKQLKKRRSSLNQSSKKPLISSQKGSFSKNKRKASLTSKSSSTKINQNDQKQLSNVVASIDHTVSVQKRNKDTCEENSVGEIFSRYPAISTKAYFERYEVCSKSIRPFSLSPIRIPLMTPDVTLKLRRRINDVITPLNLESSRSRASKFLFLTDMYPVPDCFASWSIDAVELSRKPGHSPSPSSSSDSHLKVVEYSSPLENFRSYRLCSFFKAGKNALEISSDTFSHKINCNKIICRYDLTGTCLDDKCKGQHLKDISQTPSSLFLDLLWYCPQLLKTNEGKQITIDDPINLQLKAADDTVARLCGEDKARSLEDTCALLVAVINRALSSKTPVSSVLGKKRLPMWTLSDPEDRIDDDDSEQLGCSRNFSQAVADEAAELESRYFDDEHKVRSEIKQLTAVLKQQPTNEHARIALAQAYLDQSKTDDEDKRTVDIEMALHTLCIGIELDDQSEACWSAYVPILRQHYEIKATIVEEVEILDDALLRLPLSRAVWTEIFKWRWSFVRLNSYLEQLTSNLMNRHKILTGMNLSIDDEYAYYSSWLLLCIMERCHLMLHGRSLEKALTVISTVLNDLKQPDDGESPDHQLFRPLSQEDLSKLWLIYIHLQEFADLPSCLYDQDMSKHMFGMNIGFDDVILSFSSPIKTDAKKIRELFENALACCTDARESDVVNAKRQFPIYRSMVNFEASLRKWERVSRICKDLVQLFSSDSCSSAYSSCVDVWVMWTEAVMRSNDVVTITQAFDEAVTACPGSAKLAYMAALYQLNSDSTDEEAALQYLESCIGSVVDLEGAENLSTNKLHQLYRRMLRHDVNIESSSKLIFKDDACHYASEKEKPYLWLIYCVLTELKQSLEEGEQDVEVSDLYEAALHILPSHDERKIVWIQYLLHLRSNAFQSSSCVTGSSRKAIFLERKQQLAWFSRFTSVVRRCLATTPCKYNAKLKKESKPPGSEEKITDYSFHNEVSSIYLDCFPPNQRGIALSILTDAMPTNIPLLKKAASFLLRNQDYISTVSLLWRITSLHAGSLIESCRDQQLWKMAIIGLLFDKKHKKAIRLCHVALSVFPRSKELWHDILSLTLAYGGKDDLSTLIQQYNVMLSNDINLLAKKIFLKVDESS